MAVSQASPSPQLAPGEEDFNSGGKRQETKKCGVCGDRALGYNFNAITCESCKAFFRRNALKNKEFRCPFQGQCRVDQVTRRFCQKCRLRKCLEIGMKKEWIMTEEEKRRKKQKIEENRARKIGLGQDDDDAQNCRSNRIDNSDNNDNNNGNANSDNNSGNNNLNSNNVSVISTMIPSASSSSSSSSSSSFSSLSSSSTPKPQAVVVGVIREEETQPAKVLRLEGETDVHHHRDKNQMDAPSTPQGLRDCDYVQNSPLSRNRKLNMEDRGPPLLVGPCSPTFLPSPSLHRPGEERSASSSLADVLTVNIKKETRKEYATGNEEATLHLSRRFGFQTLVNNRITPEVPHRRHGSGGRRDAPLMECTEEQLATGPGSNIHRAYRLHQPHQPQPSLHEYFNHSSPSLSPPTPPQLPLPATTATAAPAAVPAAATAATTAATTHQQGSNDVRPSLEKSCDGFSVREAMEILHPEEKNPQESTSAASVLDALLDTGIKAEFASPFSGFPPTPDQHILTEVERAKLEELSEANKGILAPLCEDYNFKDLTNPSLINIINLTEIVIRRLIKMAKRINSFKNLCQEDQIALLKGGCTEMMLLHSVSAYDPDKDSWKIQQDHSSTKDIKLKVLKAATGNVYEEHKRFALAFDPEWKQDPHIIFLLCAITLFNPKRQHIIHADAIRHEQGSYLYLTRRYLEARYGTCLGRSTYHQLLHRLAHLHHLSEDHLRLFLEVNPTQVEPLLIEIFDLKQR